MTPHFLNAAPRRTRVFAIARRGVKETGSPASTVPSNVPCMYVGIEGCPATEPLRSKVEVATGEARLRMPLTSIATHSRPNMGWMRRAGEPLSFTARQGAARGSGAARRFVQEVMQPLTSIATHQRPNMGWIQRAGEPLSFTARQGAARGSGTVQRFVQEVVLSGGRGLV